MYGSANTVGSPKAAAASRPAAATASPRSAAADTIRMPLPPPPAAAFTSTGIGTSLLTGRAPPVTSHEGRTGTPAAAMTRLAASLSPISSMTSAGGPTQVSPAPATARAKAARSARNP